MYNKLIRLVSLVALAVMTLTACGAAASSAPAATEAPIETRYIRVAIGHPKTLDINGDSLSGCPSWLTLSGTTITLAPPEGTTEGSYSCQLTESDATIQNVTVEVSKVDPIPHIEKSVTYKVTSGKENDIYIESDIYLGNAYYEFQGLQSWMVIDKMTGNRAGFVLITPPEDTIGQFTFVVNTTDYVNLSLTETITVTVIAEAPPTAAVQNICQIVQIQDTENSIRVAAAKLYYGGQEYQCDKPNTVETAMIPITTLEYGESLCLSTYSVTAIWFNGGMVSCKNVNQALLAP